MRTVGGVRDEADTLLFALSRSSEVEKGLVGAVGDIGDDRSTASSSAVVMTRVSGRCMLGRLEIIEPDRLERPLNNPSSDCRSLTAFPVVLETLLAKLAVRSLPFLEPIDPKRPSMSSTTYESAGEEGAPSEAAYEGAILA
jgi:hypothetical protein